MQYRLAELAGLAETELKRFEMELRLEEKEREYDVEFNAVRRAATKVLAEVESVRSQLAKLHQRLYETKRSKLPAEVKRQQVLDLLNVIEGLRNELHGRLGTRPPDEAVDG